MAAIYAIFEPNILGFQKKISGLTAKPTNRPPVLVRMAKPPKAFATRRPGEVSTVGTWRMLAKLANENI
jgi:hypothetical protein